MENTRVLVSPRSVTARRLDDVIELEPLRAAGYTLVATAPGRTPTEEELLALVPTCVGWLAGVEPISQAVLAASPGLRVISRNGTGVDNIDLDAAEAAGVQVERAAGANAQGVAELTVTLAMSCLRGVPQAARAVRDGRWERTPGRELADVLVGVVGLGAVGLRVARAFTALGARVVAFDPFVAAPEIETASLAVVLGTADVVSLHVPALPGGPLLDAEAIESMPDGAILINTARASLVDDDAVLAALDSGRLAAYAVDAFDHEPPDPSPLLKHEHTLATPHLGGYTDASIRRAVAEAAERLVSALGREVHS